MSTEWGRLAHSNPKELQCLQIQDPALYAKLADEYSRVMLQLE